jgi:hypothetical protein
MEAPRAGRAPLSEIDRWREEWQGARYGDSPKDSFAEARQQALEYCDAVAQVAHALRHPFKPGAADVLIASDERLGETWANEHSAIYWFGVALRWGIDGADPEELSRLRKEREVDESEEAERQVARGTAEERTERDTAERIREAESKLIELALHGLQRTAPWLAFGARPLSIDERVALVERLADALGVAGVRP